MEGSTRTVAASSLFNKRWRLLPGKASPWRGFLTGLLVLAGMMVLLGPSFRDPIDPASPQASSGIVDYSTHPLPSRPLTLGGQWRFNWVAGPGGPLPETTLYAPVPGKWTGLATPAGPLPANGHGRYLIELRGLKAGLYQLHVPSIYAASRLIIDGRVVSQRGIVTSTPEGAIPLVRAQNVPFEAQGRPVKIAIEIASWRHRDNGLEEAPVFGTAEAMDRWSALKWSRDHLYNISLIIVAMMGLAVFLFRPEDKAPLLLGLGCLFFLPTASILGFDNLLLIQMPGMSFTTMLAIQYLAVTASVTFFFAATNRLFPADSPKLLSRLILGLIALLVARQIWYLARGDTLGASETQSQVMMSLLGVLLIIMVIVARATWRRREGAAIFLLGISLFIGSVMLNSTVSLGWLGSDAAIGYQFTSLGIVMLLYSQIVLMAERWALAVRLAEHINDDLRQLLEVNTAITSDLQLGTLLEKIVAVTSKILGADRSSLFLKQEREDSLVSLVAEGVQEQTIAFDSGHGIAGYAFATGESVIIPDAYADPRFNRAIDEATGYRTKTILTVPIAARDGRRLGVMQALNRVDGQSFADDDAARMAAFGSQAAIAIDNARLFGEVVAARNFDESILSSMSAGVIALDHEWTITKLNQAAADTLGTSMTVLEGLNARILLERKNPWLVAEVSSVFSDGEPKFLVDIDLVTAREKPEAVNLSIVPLRLQDEAPGALILIEDISEEKRLQGMMRRFMSQSVVDQVLGREDDLMFGTACEASVLFADIRGFTSLAEKLSPRETVETLNELFGELFEAVAVNDGVLDKFIGDAIMAVFGAPLSTDRDPLNAVSAGLEMLRMIGEISAARGARGEPPVRLGIGIASGEVVAGTIGSVKRMDYTVIGDSVNLASRLQDLTKTYGIEMLVDEATARAVTPTHALREIDRIIVRGRERPESIFEVSDPSFRNSQLLAAYAKGRETLALREWAAAISAFEQAMELDPTDMPSRLMLERARVLADDPPERDWDGVWRAPAKD